MADLARLDLSSAKPAVLSACQTALGGTALPDEAIRLAGALLLGNFRHVDGGGRVVSARGLGVVRPLRALAG